MWVIHRVENPVDSNSDFTNQDIAMFAEALTRSTIVFQDRFFLDQTKIQDASVVNAKEASSCAMLARF